MLTKGKLPLWLCWCALLCCTPLSVAQGPARTAARPAPAATQDPAEDVLRVNTRAVFIDTLVKDKRTGTPVAGLTRDNFVVLDDGRSREIAYFSAGSRRPRALMLVIDFHGHWGRTFHNKETVARLAASLAKLPPEDELSIAVSWLGKASSPCSPLSPDSPQTPPPLRVLQDFTRDRGKVIDALKTVPDLSKTYERDYKRIDWDFSFEDTTSGVACAADALRRASRERPNSQALMVVAADDLTYFPFTVRDEVIRGLLETGVTVNLLRTRTFFLTGWAAGVAKRTDFAGKQGTIEVVADVAGQTGGEVARVGGAKKYVEAFEKLVGDLAARYTLGFTLKGDEQSKGRLHKLEVRVKAVDGRGKERRVAVSARKGYYSPDE